MWCKTAASLHGGKPRMQDERKLEFIQFTVRRGITSRLAHLKCTVRNAVAGTSVRIARRRVISARRQYKVAIL